MTEYKTKYYMKTLKQLLPVILCFGGLYLSQWLFNHVNAWVGIVSFVVVSSASVDYIIKCFKK